MGVKLDEIKKNLEKLTPEEKVGYLKHNYKTELKNIFEELIKKLMAIQKKMSVYHNGYEEIKRGKAPSEIKKFLKDLGYSEAEDMPNPSIAPAIRWILDIIEGGTRELNEWVNDVLVYVTKALGSKINLESVSVTASIPPSITFNFKLESS